MISVKITGLKELEARIKKANSSLRQEIDARLESGAEEIRGNAVKDSPADQGLLRSGIQYQRTGELKYTVFSNAVYSGYQEFGTKSKVIVPSGLESVAAQLKGGGGSSLKAREAIYEWCRRKGIEKSLWWPIFIKIMTTGIKPHPFFFKQLNIVQPKVIKQIENILKSL